MPQTGYTGLRLSGAQRPGALKRTCGFFQARIHALRTTCGDHTVGPIGIDHTIYPHHEMSRVRHARGNSTKSGAEAAVASLADHPTPRATGRATFKPRGGPIHTDVSWLNLALK